MSVVAVGVYSIRTGGVLSLRLAGEGLCVHKLLGTYFVPYRDVEFIAPGVLPFRWLFGWMIPFRAVVIEVKGTFSPWRRVVIYDPMAGFDVVLVVLSSMVPVISRKVFL